MILVLNYKKVHVDIIRVKTNSTYGHTVKTLSLLKDIGLVDKTKLEDSKRKTYYFLTDHGKRIYKILKDIFDILKIDTDFNKNKLNIKYSNYCITEPVLNMKSSSYKHL